MLQERAEGERQQLEAMAAARGEAQEQLRSSKETRNVLSETFFVHII